MSTTNLLTNASATTPSAGSSPLSNSEIFPKSVITICILIGGFLLGVLVAKLVNYCYNRADIPDNASDISEHTKELLKIQLALMKFGKAAINADADADPEEVKRKQQAAVLSMWKMKAMDKAAEQRAKEEKAHASVQVVDEEAARKGKKIGAAASAKPGGVGPAGKGVVAGPKTKTFSRPRKLFPSSSLAGVAPLDASPVKSSATPSLQATGASSKPQAKGDNNSKSDSKPSPNT